MPGQQQESKMMKYSRRILIIVYVLLVVAFFIAEIGAQLNISWLQRVRATNQVLILLGLLFFPFLLFASISLLQRLKVTVGGVEVDAEFVKIEGKFEAIETEQSQLSGRLDHTQQVFLSILRGKDPSCEKRLKIPKLVIGCKDFKEQKVLSLLLAQHIMGALEIDCKCLIPNGGTLKNHFDLIHGWIDGYIEYTGTGCMLLGIESEGVQDLKRLNKRSKELDHGITWLEPLGFTNNYVIVANKNKIKKVKYIHQLTGEADQLTFGGNLEFMNRSDGYPGLCKTYNLNFRKEVICSYHDRYRLLKEQKVDVIDGFETDPELEDDDFKVLEESRQPPFFPEYHALPVFREDALDKIKGLRDVVEQFKDRLGKINRIEVIAQFSDFSGTDKDEFEAAEKQARKIVEEIDKNVRMGSGQEMA